MVTLWITTTTALCAACLIAGGVFGLAAGVAMTKENR